MKSLQFIMFIMATLFLMLTTQACTGITYNVKGRVVDAETGEPIKGAAISSLWYHYQLVPRLAGLSSGSEVLGTYDTLTDSDGYFETTKHLSGVNDISVYKKGYVGWCDNYIFNPTGKKLKRDDFDFGNNMIIKLEPFKEHYSKTKHAAFVVEYLQHTSSGSTFTKAIGNEKKNYYKNNK